jgi:UDP-GlcNAc:undecaprenyl-phosphate/decaprenyl-phosphate GlcNAc-1-phosphate transferase
MKDYFNYVILFVVLALVSFAINTLLLRFVETLGIRRSEWKQVRWSQEAKPSVGGLSFFISFLLSITVSFLFLANQPMVRQPEYTGLILASTLAFLIGLADDSFNTNPLLKFLGQVLCALLLIINKVVIPATDVPIYNDLITALWTIGLMNSINMLDNMDGITASVAYVILLGCLFAAFQQHAIFLAEIIIGVLAALTGFLYFNQPDSSMYMGDTGSQFIGLFLSAVSILTLWNYRDLHYNGIQFLQCLIPLFCFAVPIFDTTTVIIHRLSRGQSPFVGGRDHTTHHFYYLGLNEKQVMWLISAMSAAACLIGIFLMQNFRYVTSDICYYLSIGYVLLFAIIQFLYMRGKKRSELMIKTKIKPSQSLRYTSARSQSE